MDGLFITIIVIIIFSRIFVRFILPIIIKRKMKKFQDRVNEHKTSREPNRRDGEVKVSQKEKSEQHLGSDVGEYVDFEDVDE